MDILMVLSSHDRLGDGERWTGFGLAGFAAAYYAFKDAGAEITLASPQGGQPPINPAGDPPTIGADPVARFKQDWDARTALADTLRLDQVHPADFDGACYPEGSGTLWDLAQDQYSILLIAAFHGATKPLALIGHAPAALLSVADAQGRSVLAGRNVTGMPRSEEAAMGLAGRLPFALADALTRRGGRYSQGPDFSSYVVRDGALITGQNAASSAAAARALLDALGAAEIVPQSGEPS